MALLLVIVRGLPGSGKTTLAKKLGIKFHYEADDFFISNGVYKFDPVKISSAHELCQRRAFEALKRNHDVVVSNTFTQRWEIEPYLKMAKTTGAIVQEITCKGDWKSVHNVPKSAIEKMKLRWEE